MIFASEKKRKNIYSKVYVAPDHRVHIGEAVKTKSPTNENQPFALNAPNGKSNNNNNKSTHLPFTTAVISPSNVVEDGSSEFPKYSISSFIWNYVDSIKWL